MNRGIITKIDFFVNAVSCMFYAVKMIIKLIIYVVRRLLIKLGFFLLGVK